MKDNILGECTCHLPLIVRNGTAKYPKDFGKYFYNTPQCKLYEPKVPVERQHIRLEMICGNCRWWEECIEGV